MSVREQEKRRDRDHRVATVLAALLIAFGWAFLGSSPIEADEKQALKIVFIAYENPNQLAENVEPVVDYLEQRLGRDVEHFAATDYAAVVEALRRGSADVGFMGPLQYVMAKHQAGAKALLGEVYQGSPIYHSRIYVRKDSGFASLADLKGKTIAFTDPISSSGYMYPLDVFKSDGLIDSREDADEFFKRVYFAGGDEQAIRAVLNGFVDAAGIGEFSIGLLRGEERDQVKHLAESRPIPSHCIVARKGLDPELEGAFRQALLDLNEGPNQGLLQHLYGVDGYIEVDASTYAEVEEVARGYGFIR